MNEQLHVIFHQKLDPFRSKLAVIHEFQLDVF